MTHPHLEGLIPYPENNMSKQKWPVIRFADESEFREWLDSLTAIPEGCDIGPDTVVIGPKWEPAQRALRALAALPGAGDWQPIETAPYADFEGTHPITCLVYSKRFGVQMGRAWRYTDGEACGQAIGFNGNWEVTHWMPLPSSPTTNPHEADRNG